MELHGSLQTNLAAAVASIMKFRGQIVYAETLQYWNSLLSTARRQELQAGDHDRRLDFLMDALASELAGREQSGAVAEDDRADV